MSRLIDADAIPWTVLSDGIADGNWLCVAKFVDEVNKMPTIEQRKTGKWIELTNTNHTYVCSVCGRMLVNITDGKNKVAEHYPFCHCGARMVQEGDEHDKG